MSDEELKKEEGDKRGRREVRRERNASVSAIKNKVGQKRAASNVLEPGVEMDSDDEGEGIRKDIRGSLGK
jgi:hypothetical protein|tara:strand:- start:169 stop:378 length:210 start_codon:yes stop_codon:yes gene_type:complete